MADSMAESSRTMAIMPLSAVARARQAGLMAFSEHIGSGPDNLLAAPFPLPGTRRAAVAVAAPGPGPQQWAGAPSAAFDVDGSVVLAYRVRAEQDFNVVARSVDGERFTTVGILAADRLGAAMVERPALVRTGSGVWRLYVSCATPGTKHWWIGVVRSRRSGGIGRGGRCALYSRATRKRPSRIR